MADLPSANPGIDCFPITPDDGAPLAVFPRVLLIGTAGSLKIDTLAGNTVTLPGVPAGQFSCGVRKVYLTGTSAANIVGIV